MMFGPLVFVVALYLSSASASYVKHGSPAATGQSNGLYSHGVIPEPTAGPNDQELRRRQPSQVTVRTVLEAPDNTCGYFGGNTASAWGCTAGENCIFATPTTIAPMNSTNSTQTSTSAPTAGSVLCCDATAGCPAQPAPTACVDMGKYDYNKTCTGSCPHDPMTLKCTSGIYLYCNTVTFSTPDISALFCNYISTYDALPAVTVAGLTTAAVHFATTANPTTSTPTIANTSSTASATSSATSVAASGPPKPVNKKAIIGGVVGGVLGLCLIVGLVLLFLAWRNAEVEEEPVPTKDEKGKSVDPVASSDTPSEVVVGTRTPKSVQFK